MTKYHLLIISFLIIILTAFKTDKPFVMYKGEKYYKCYTNKVNLIDTVFVPGGFMIVSDQTKTTYYDHFNCDEVE